METYMITVISYEIWNVFVSYAWTLKGYSITQNCIFDENGRLIAKYIGE